MCHDCVSGAVSAAGLVLWHTLLVSLYSTDQMGNLCPITTGSGMHCVNNHRQTDRQTNKAIHAGRQTGGVNCYKREKRSLM